jgi:hypothetical protein
MDARAGHSGCCVHGPHGLASRERGPGGPSYGVPFLGEASFDTVGLARFLQTATRPLLHLGPDLELGGLVRRYRGVRYNAVPRVLRQAALLLPILRATVRSWSSMIENAENIADEWAPNLERYRAGGEWRGRIFRDMILADARRMKPKPTILDIGCGGGLDGDCFESAGNGMTAVSS